VKESQSLWQVAAPIGTICSAVNHERGNIVLAGLLGERLGSLVLPVRLSEATQPEQDAP
jgi:hypothetical protein